jgi:hypothetical protein
MHPSILSLHIICFVRYLYYDRLSGKIHVKSASNVHSALLTIGKHDIMISWNTQENVRFPYSAEQCCSDSTDWQRDSRSPEKETILSHI